MDQLCCVEIPLAFWNAMRRMCFLSCAVIGVMESPHALLCFSGGALEDDNGCWPEDVECVSVHISWV